MRALRNATGTPGRARLAVAGCLTLLLSLAVVGAPALADETPSRAEVRDAEQATEAARQDVAGIRAALAVADADLEAAGIAAAQAAEAYNGALYAAEQAEQAARQATTHAATARASVEQQRRAYSSSMVSTYQSGPELTGFSAILGSDGIGAVVERTATLEQAEQALDGRFQAFSAASILADVSEQSARAASQRAEQARERAEDARTAAGAAADAAAARASAVAVEKDRLIVRLAKLQGISTSLARQRQQALEEAAAEEAAEAAEQEAEQAEQDTQAEQANDDDAPDGPDAPPGPSSPETGPSDDNDDQNTPGDTTTPDPGTTPPPVNAGGASRAVAFAKAQIGEPYVWGAAGPRSWDCSGLTMKAWAAGGKSLPHYSVAQYTGSTPVRPSQLRAGDLVFWGSSSSPSSIYHVALYIGGGQIIHAPRTGRPVTQESMYYWRTPNFYARP